MYSYIIQFVTRLIVPFYRPQSPTCSQHFAPRQQQTLASLFVLFIRRRRRRRALKVRRIVHPFPSTAARRGRLLRYYTLSPVRRTGRARASVEPQLSRNRRFRWRAGCIQLHGGILPPPAPNNTPIPLHPPSLGAMRRLLTRAGRLGREAPVLPPPPRETVVVIGLASCRPQAPGLLVRVEM